MNDIAKCPYCGQMPFTNQGTRFLFCKTNECLLCDVDFLPENWNTLCADIEKGRECGAMVAKAVGRYEALSEYEDAQRRHLETAVGLEEALEIIHTLRGADNEATDSPWWTIIDPEQMLRIDVHTIASMIEGPFFSRADAEQYLKGRSYAYSDKAVVYCHSGYGSTKYKSFCRAITGCEATKWE